MMLAGKKVIFGILWFFAFEILIFVAIGVGVAKFSSIQNLGNGQVAGAVVAQIMDRYAIYILGIPFLLALLGSITGFLPGTKGKSNGRDGSMKEFRIYAHPNKSVPVVVKIGFSWSAFIIGPLWFLLHQMWINFLIATAFFVGFIAYFHSDNPTTGGGLLFHLGMDILFLATWLLVGNFANRILCLELEGQGYRLSAKVTAKNSSAAKEETFKGSSNGSTAS